MSLPLKAGIKLCKAGSDQNPNSHALDVTQFHCRSLTSSMNYLPCTCRPDITYACNQLSRYNNAPTVEHWNLAIDLLRYLKGTKHWGIALGRKHPQMFIHDDESPERGVKKHLDLDKAVHGYNVDAQAFCDANHVVGIDDKNSISGQLLHVLLAQSLGAHPHKLRPLLQAVNQK